MSQLNFPSHTLTRHGTVRTGVSLFTLGTYLTQLAQDVISTSDRRLVLAGAVYGPQFKGLCNSEVRADLELLM